jgi:hypothetical protein
MRRSGTAGIDRYQYHQIPASTPGTAVPDPSRGTDTSGTEAISRLSLISAPQVETSKTAPLPADLFDALVEELASALVADFKANPTITVGSPSGSNRSV